MSLEMIGFPTKEKHTVENVGKIERRFDKMFRCVKHGLYYVESCPECRKEKEK